jgi:hypothetical protein
MADRKITNAKLISDNLKIEVDAEWLDELPSDLKLLLANLFGLVSVEQSTNGRVERKSIEGYSVTYRDTDDYQQLVKDFESTIRKYSLCNIGEISSGEVKNERIYQLF